jgi:hypothetical protein
MYLSRDVYEIPTTPLIPYPDPESHARLRLTR